MVYYRSKWVFISQAPRASKITSSLLPHTILQLHCQVLSASFETSGAGHCLKQDAGCHGCVTLSNMVKSLTAGSRHLSRYLRLLPWRSYCMQCSSCRGNLWACTASKGGWKAGGRSARVRKHRGWPAVPIGLYRSRK